jgi:hypothetical protein
MLTKPLAGRFIPGSPEIPYRAAVTHCGPTPAPGYWQMVCDGIWLPNGYQCPYNGANVPGHDHSKDPIRYVFVQTVCRSEFVQTGPVGPVVCTTYPEQQFVAAVPPHVETYQHLGWNAGANSIEEQAGDFIMRDTMGQVVGVTWGIAETRDDVEDPNRLTHAFLFGQTTAGNPRFAIVESGSTVVPYQPYSLDDEFSIRRVAGVVTYLHGDQVIYRSTTRSTGTVMVGSSIYASGDQIP